MKKLILILMSVVFILTSCTTPIDDATVDEITSVVKENTKNPTEEKTEKEEVKENTTSEEKVVEEEKPSNKEDKVDTVKEETKSEVSEEKESDNKTEEVPEETVDTKEEKVINEVKEEEPVEEETKQEVILTRETPQKTYHTVTINWYDGSTLIDSFDYTVEDEEIITLKHDSIEDKINTEEIKLFNLNAREDFKQSYKTYVIDYENNTTDVIDSEVETILINKTVEKTTKTKFTGWAINEVGIDSVNGEQVSILKSKTINVYATYTEPVVTEKIISKDFETITRKRTIVSVSEHYNIENYLDTETPEISINKEMYLTLGEFNEVFTNDTYNTFDMLNADYYDGGYKYRNNKYHGVLLNGGNTTYALLNIENEGYRIFKNLNEDELKNVPVYHFKAWIEEGISDNYTTYFTNPTVKYVTETKYYTETY